MKALLARFDSNLHPEECPKGHVSKDGMTHSEQPPDVRRSQPDDSGGATAYGSATDSDDATEGEP